MNVTVLGGGQMGKTCKNKSKGNNQGIRSQINCSSQRRWSRKEGEIHQQFKKLMQSYTPKYKETGSGRVQKYLNKGRVMIIT